MTSGSDKGTYLINCIEYIPSGPSPHNPDLDDPDVCSELLAETVQSITDQEAE